MPKLSKELALVLVTFAPMTKASRKNKVVLKRVLYIHYLLCFHKEKKNKMQALINCSSKINTMTLTYISKLGSRVRQINAGAQKINDSTFETFEIILVSFQVENRAERACFSQETFLLADTSMKMILGMPYLTFSNTDIKFAKKKLTWRSYTFAKVLPTTKQMKLIGKKEFAKVALDGNSEMFVMYVAILKALLLGIIIHPLQKA